MKKALCLLLVSSAFFTPLISQDLVSRKMDTGLEEFRIAKTRIISFYQGMDIGQIQRLYAYDNHNNLVEYKTQQLIDGIWGDWRVDYYIYNDDDLMIEQQHGSKEYPSQPWYMSTKNLFFYDDEQRLSLMERFFKAFTEAEWKLMGESNYTYENNDRHKIEEYISIDYPILNHFVHYYYDNNMRLLEESKYRCNENNPYDKLTLKYDPDGKVLQILDEYWYSDGSSHLREDFYYNDDLLITKEIFNWEDGEWILSERTVNTYDNFGNRISEKIQKYPGDGWDNFQLLENTYDEHYNLIEQFQYEWRDSAWSLRYQFLHEWELKSTSGIDQNAQISEVDSYILIFPNPTSGIINISGMTKPSEVRIYSIQGQLIKSVNLVENSVDISDLPRGVYVLNISSRNNYDFRKIVIKR